MKSLFKVAIAVLVIAGIGFAGYTYNKQQKQALLLKSPEYALLQLEKHARARNLEGFKKQADINSIATSIVEQMITEPEETEENGLFKNLASRVQGKFATYIKPELTHSVTAQLVTFIKDGKPQDEADLTSLYTAKPLITRLWDDLGGDALTVEKMVITNTDPSDDFKQALLYLKRDDLGYKGSVILTLKQTPDSWKVVSVDGLTKVLDAMKKANISKINKENAKAKQKMDTSLRIRNIAKAQSNSTIGMGKALLIRAAFKNTGATDIIAFSAKISFLDKTGTLLKTVSINDSDMLMKNDTSEKSWQLIVNPISPKEAQLYDTPMDDLKTSYGIESITFIDGTTLSFKKAQ